MSTIHEALKKAQKDRDIKYLHQSAVLVAGGGNRRALHIRYIRFSVLLIVTILLVFLSYSWLDSQRNPVSKRYERVSLLSDAHNDTHMINHNAEIFYKRARQLQESDKFQDAKEQYQMALTIDPGYVEALNNLGVLHIRDKEFQRSRSNFEKAIRLKPMYVEPYYNMACLHAIHGEVKKSLEYLKKAISLDQAVRQWAKRDTDLKQLWETPDFITMIGDVEQGGAEESG